MASIQNFYFPLDILKQILSDCPLSTLPKASQVCKIWASCVNNIIDSKISKEYDCSRETFFKHYKTRHLILRKIKNNIAYKEKKIKFKISDLTKRLIDRPDTGKNLSIYLNSSELIIVLHNNITILNIKDKKPKLKTILINIPAHICYPKMEDENLSSFNKGNFEYEDSYKNLIRLKQYFPDSLQKLRVFFNMEKQSLEFASSEPILDYNEQIVILYKDKIKLEIIEIAKKSAVFSIDFPELVSYDFKDDILVAITRDHSLIGIDVKQKVQLFNFKFKTNYPGYVDPHIICPERLVIRTGYQEISIYDLKTGKVLFTLPFILSREREGYNEINSIDFGCSKFIAYQERTSPILSVIDSLSGQIEKKYEFTSDSNIDIIHNRMIVRGNSISFSFISIYDLLNHEHLKTHKFNKDYQFKLVPWGVTDLVMITLCMRTYSYSSNKKLSKILDLSSGNLYDADFTLSRRTNREWGFVSLKHFIDYNYQQEKILGIGTNKVDFTIDIHSLIE